MSPVANIVDLFDAAPLSAHLANNPNAASLSVNVKEEDKPKVLAPNFVLAYLPDPVYSWVNRMCGPHEPLPFIPTCPEKYYVVIKGFKIGIFMEEW